MSDKEVVWVPITVRITNTETNETREFQTKLYTTKDYDGIWHWEEGNNSCDCNRLWDFERAGGEELTEEPPCGDGFFTVELIRDGKTIYSE